MEKIGLDARWIVLGTDGRHVSLGRTSDPSPQEVAQAETALRQQGLSGWLAVMKGGYYEQAAPSLMMVRPLSDPEQPFSKAVECFLAKRKNTLSAVA